MPAPLAAILLLALAGRLALCFGVGLPWLTPDSTNYLRMAEAIAAGRPFALFPNGYPLLAAALGARPAALVALNALASTATVWLVYDLARGLGVGERPALLATAAAAVYPNQLVYVHYVLSDPMATLCLTAGLALLCHRRYAAGGVLLGLACTLRSSLFAVLALCALLLAWRAGAPAAWRRLAAGAAVVGAAYAGLCAAGVVLPANNAGQNLLLAVGSPSSSFEYSLEPFDAEQRRRPLRTYASSALAEPGRFAAQRLSALWELWGPWPGDAERPAAARLLLGLRLPLLLLALLALLAPQNGGRRLDVLLLAAPALALTLVHVATFATPRFTLPAEPALLALAAFSLWGRSGPEPSAGPGSSDR